MRKFLPFFLTVSFLGLPAVHPAGPGADAPAERHWEFAGWEGGGCYPNVEFDPSVRDRVYLTSDVAGIWRSDDLGEHWRFVTRGLRDLNVSAVAIAPSDPEVLYAATASGVFRSRDGAGSWQAAPGAGLKMTFSRPNSHRPLAVSAADPSRVIAGTSKGAVFYSRDFGDTWTLLGRPFSGMPLITALSWMEPEGLLFASSDQGLSVYSFSKKNWSRFEAAPRPVSDFQVLAGAIYAAAGNKIGVSRDGGRTWAHSSATPKGVFYRLRVLDREGRALLGARNDAWSADLLKSGDSGATWRVWDKDLAADTVSNPTRVWASPRGRINALKQDPFREQVLFRTDWWGVWRSDDGGASWKEKIKGAPNTVTSDIVLSPNGDIYVATMDNGLLVSSDGGRNYRTLFPARGYADDVNGHVWRAVFSGKRLLATSSPWTADLNQVVWSDDRGATFKKSRVGLPSRKPRKETVWKDGFARALAAVPSRPGLVYLGIDGQDGGGLYVSRDGGAVFTRSPGQPGALGIYNALAVDPRAPERLLWGSAGKKTGGIYYSEDGGAKWSRSAAPALEVFDLAFASDGTAYAAGQDARSSPVICRSSDGGKSWKLLKKFEGRGSAEALCVLPDGRLAGGVVRWHSHAPGLFFLASADGKTWQDLHGDLPEGEGPSAMAYDEDSGTLYMARTSGSVYKTQL